MSKHVKRDREAFDIPSMRLITSQSGLTLLESMIALLIFSVGILGTVSMQTGSLYMNARAQSQMQDIAAASQYLESILSLPFDDPLLEDFDNGYSPDSPDYGPVGIASTSSTIEWEVDGRYFLPNTKRLTITVRFHGKNGLRKIFRYEYLKAKGYL